MAFLRVRPPSFSSDNLFQKATPTPEAEQFVAHIALARTKQCNLERNYLRSLSWTRWTQHLGLSPETKASPPPGHTWPELKRCMCCGKSTTLLYPITQLDGPNARLLAWTICARLACKHPTGPDHLNSAGFPRILDEAENLHLVESLWLEFDRLHWPGAPDSTALHCFASSPPSTAGFPISFLLTASAINQATTSSTQSDAPSLRSRLLHRHARRVPLPAMLPPSPVLLCAAADNDRRQVFSDSPLNRVRLPHPPEFQPLQFNLDPYGLTGKSMKISNVPHIIVAVGLNPIRLQPAPVAYLGKRHLAADTRPGIYEDRKFQSFAVPRILQCLHRQDGLSVVTTLISKGDPAGALMHVDSLLHTLGPSPHLCTQSLKLCEILRLDERLLKELEAPQLEPLMSSNTIASRLHCSHLRLAARFDRPCIPFNGSKIFSHCHLLRVPPPPPPTDSTRANLVAPLLEFFPPNSSLLSPISLCVVKALQKPKSPFAKAGLLPGHCITTIELSASPYLVDISQFSPTFDDLHAFLLSRYESGVLVGFHVHMLIDASYHRWSAHTIREVHTPDASKQIMCEFASHLYDSLDPLRALECLVIARSRRKRRSDTLNADNLHDDYLNKCHPVIAQRQLNTDISQAQRFIKAISTTYTPRTHPPLTSNLTGQIRPLNSILQPTAPSAPCSSLTNYVTRSLPWDFTRATPVTLELWSRSITGVVNAYLQSGQHALDWATVSLPNTMSLPPTPDQIQEVAAARSLLQTNVLPLSTNSQFSSSLSTSTASSSSSSSSSSSISSSSSSRPTPHVRGPTTPTGPILCSGARGDSSLLLPHVATCTVPG
eukprot:CAMPEP_0171985858 /NCGR_PEP_ID=MMETSP0993-20121228/274573_1 /TAXON_ID=483369 /ORGANISM="non described non described, Strain CCMP2098" /LENGTH=829 /DNA_ID=CAMNT_0012638747 /DNA_START=1304 /DNA_END=3788 /DNA_ORIENTATION=-